MKVTCAHGLVLGFTSKRMNMLQMQITKEVESFKTTMTCLFHPYYKYLSCCTYDGIRKMVLHLGFYTMQSGYKFCYKCWKVFTN